MQTINLQSPSAKAQLESLAERETFFANIMMGEHKITLMGRFGKDGVYNCFNQAGPTHYTPSECRQLIDYALGNISESECFWFEPETPSREEIEEEREYQKFWHCQPRYSF